MSQTVVQDGSPRIARTEVLDKAIRILELLADNPSGLCVSQVAEHAVLPKTSAHRLLLSWVGLGYVSRLPNGDFALGLQAIELSRRVARRNRPVEICHGLLRKLQALSGESVYFGVYRSGSVVLVDAVESAHPLRVVVDLGEQCHLHASAQGLVVAAFLERSVLEQKLLEKGLFRLTKRTNTNWRGLRARLQMVRERGYAVNDGETVEGAVCIGAPVFAGSEGPVLGSIGISTPESRATPAERERQQHLILQAANEMTLALAGLQAEPEALPREHSQKTAASPRRESSRVQ